MQLPIFQGLDSKSFSLLQTRWASLLNPTLENFNFDSGVITLNKLFGDIELVGSGISITPSGNTLTFAVTAGTGVTSLNGLSGALTLLGTSGITITPSGSDITIDQSANLDGGSADAVYLVSQVIDGGHA